jgi:hypothetical protein
MSYNLVVMCCPQTATALGKLGHPEGEKNLTRSAGKYGVVQMVRTLLLLVMTILSPTNKIPTLASCSFDEIVDAAVEGQTQWLQLLVIASGERQHIHTGQLREQGSIKNQGDCSAR